MIKNSLSFIFLFLLNLPLFSQENIIIDSNTKRRIQASFLSSRNKTIENWYFDFSCKDSLVLKSILSHTEKSLLLKVDSLYLDKNTSSKTKGYYIAECKDISQDSYVTKKDLEVRVKKFIKAFKKTPIKLVAIGFEYKNLHSQQKTNQTTVLDTLTTIDGYIFGMENTALPYTAVGIKNSNYSTISDQFGYFRLELPSTKKDNINITIKHLGYKEKNIPLKELVLNNRITLSPSKNLLNEVKVVSSLNKGIKKKVLGDKGKTRTYGFVHGSKEGSEIAKKINPKNKQVFINKASVYIGNIHQENFILLLNIYEEDSTTHLPGKPLLPKQVIVNSNIDHQWLEVNINQYNIVTNKPFYIAFQWINKNTDTPSIGISGKNGVTRISSFEQWKDSGQFNWMINAEVTYINDEI